MKTKLLTIVILFLSLNLFAQNRIIFSLGMGYKQGMENKIDKYFEKHKDKYTVLYFCPQQKIYVIDTQMKTYEFVEKMINRFNVQFVPKEESQITDPECLSEYKALKKKNFTN